MNIVVLLSGGVGSRINYEIPKQYIAVCGERIVTRTLYVALSHPLVDIVQIVSAPDWRDTIEKDIHRFLEKNAESGLAEKIRGFSIPGLNRQLSIYNALLDLEGDVADEDVILVQDAVRPLTSYQQITDCLEKIEGHDGALPVLSMKDTVYVSENGLTISRLLDRSAVFAGQAPEAYRYGKYKKACEALLPDEIKRINGAAEPAVMAGMDIAIIPGDDRNFKITTPDDLSRYRLTMKMAEE